MAARPCLEVRSKNMRSERIKNTIIASIFVSVMGTSASMAGTFAVDTHGVMSTVVGAEHQVQTVHYVPRRHAHTRARVHRRVYVPNAIVTVDGVNGSATASRSVSGNGDGTWSAERSRSVTNDNTGVTCSRNGSYESGTGVGTFSRSCSD